MKLLLLLLVGLQLCGGDLTIYRPVQAGGGWRIRLPLYVDGKFIGKIKGGERVTLSLPDGKHALRIAENMDTVSVIELRGNQIFRQRMDARAEEIFLVDPLVKDEFEKTKPLGIENMKEGE